MSTRTVLEKDGQSIVHCSVPQTEEAELSFEEHSFL